MPHLSLLNSTFKVKLDPDPTDVFKWFYWSPSPSMA